jgi:hypothetical protein
MVFMTCNMIFPLVALGELFLHVVLVVAPHCVGLSTVAVLSDRSRSNLILLELIVPHLVPLFSA